MVWVPPRGTCRFPPEPAGAPDPPPALCLTPGEKPVSEPFTPPPVFLVKRDGGACVDLARRVKQPRI